MPIQYGGLSSDWFAQNENRYLIYESFRAETLKDVRDYMDFVVSKRSVLPDAYSRANYLREFA